VDNRLTDVLAEQPYPLCFVTVSGAHLYGFPSSDSDYDLRGAHVLPAQEVLGLDVGRETIEDSRERDGMEVDLVTHDVKKFFSLLLRRNGYALEQLYSPLVAHTTHEHQELKVIAKGCITRHHWHHYAAFAASEWKLFAKEDRRRTKRLLYLYRVLLAGIHLMRTGEVEANLVHLNEGFRLPYLADLIARKMAGSEEMALDDTDALFHEREYHRLAAIMEEAATSSSLPDKPSTKPALNDLLVRLRMQSVR